MIISVFGRVENIVGKRKKMLVTSIFSFSPNVLKRLLFHTRQKVSLCGNGIMHLCYVSLLMVHHSTLSQTSPWFLQVCRRGLLKTLLEKRKLLITSNFSFSHSVSYPFGELFAIFIKFGIVVCSLEES